MDPLPPGPMLYTIPMEVVIMIVSFVIYGDAPQVNVVTGLMSHLGFFPCLWSCRRLRYAGYKCLTDSLFVVPLLPAMEMIENVTRPLPLHIQLSGCYAEREHGWLQVDVGSVDLVSWLTSRPEIMNRVAQWTVCCSHPPNRECLPDLLQHTWPTLKRIVLGGCWPLQPVQARQLESYRVHLSEMDDYDLSQLVENVLVPCASTLCEIELVFPLWTTAHMAENGIHGSVTLPRVHTFATGPINMPDAIRFFDTIELKPGIVKRAKLTVNLRQYMPGTVETLLDKCSWLPTGLKCALVKTVLGSDPFHFQVEFFGWQSHPECDSDYSGGVDDISVDVEVRLECKLSSETVAIPVQEHFEYAVAHLIRRLMHSDPSILYLEWSHNAPPYDVDWNALYDCGVHFVSPYTPAHSRVRKNGEREREEREEWRRAMEEWRRAMEEREREAAGDVEDEDEGTDEDDDGQEEDSDEGVSEHYFEGMYTREEIVELENIAILFLKSQGRLAH